MPHPDKGSLMPSQEGNGGWIIGSIIAAIIMTAIIFTFMPKKEDASPFTHPCGQKACLPAPKPKPAPPKDESCLRGQIGVLRAVYTEKEKLEAGSKDWSWESSISFDMPDGTVIACRFDDLKYDEIWKPGMRIRSDGGVRDTDLTDE